MNNTQSPGVMYIKYSNSDRSRLLEKIFNLDSLGGFSGMWSAKKLKQDIRWKLIRYRDGKSLEIYLEPICGLAGIYCRTLGLYLESVDIPKWFVDSLES